MNIDYKPCPACHKAFKGNRGLSQHRRHCTAYQTRCLCVSCEGHYSPVAFVPGTSVCLSCAGLARAWVAAFAVWVANHPGTTDDKTMRAIRAQAKVAVIESIAGAPKSLEHQRRRENVAKWVANRPSRVPHVEVPPVRPLAAAKVVLGNLVSGFVSLLRR